MAFGQQGLPNIGFHANQPFGGLRGAMRNKGGGGRQRGISVGPWGHVNVPSFFHQAGTGGGAGGKPPSASSSGGAPVTGGGSGAGGQASPLDSTYFQNVGQHQFETNNQVNSLNMRQSNASTNLQQQLAQLAHQQPLDQLRLEQQANQRGGLYATPYGQQLGQLNHGYLGKQSGLQDNYGQLVASLASQIAGAKSGELLYEKNQAESAAERASAAAQKNPALGESARPLTRSPSAPTRGRFGSGGGGRRGGGSGLARAIAMGRPGGMMF